MIEPTRPDFESPMEAVLDFDAPLQPTPKTLKDPSLYTPANALQRIEDRITSEGTQPASASPKELVTNKYVDELHDEYLERLDPNQDLKAALSRSSSPKAQKFLEVLVNPKKSNKSITRLARECGLYPIDVIDILRSYHLTKATEVYISSAPSIAEDIVEDSRTTEIECRKCDGFKEVIHPKPKYEKDAKGKLVAVDNWVTCPRCNGTGKERKPGSPHARKQVAEVVGWTKNKASIHIQVGGNQGMESVIDDVEAAIPEFSRAGDVIDITPEQQ